MSYWSTSVVELDKSEKRCPLCQTEVINPREPFDEKAVRPYPRRLDPITRQINRRFIGSLITIVLAFPALLCGAIDFSQAGRLTWSAYVIGALVLVWSWTVPLLPACAGAAQRHFYPRRTGVALYLFLIAWLQQVCPGICRWPCRCHDARTP
jgi:hypothetical protein